MPFPSTNQIDPLKPLFSRFPTTESVKNSHFSTIHILLEQVPFTESRANFYTSLTLTLTLNRKAHATHTVHSTTKVRTSSFLRLLLLQVKEDVVTLLQEKKLVISEFSPREIAWGARAIIGNGEQLPFVVRLR